MVSMAGHGATATDTAMGATQMSHLTASPLLTDAKSAHIAENLQDSQHLLQQAHVDSSHVEAKFKPVEAHPDVQVNPKGLEANHLRLMKKQGKKIKWSLKKMMKKFGWNRMTIKSTIVPPMEDTDRLKLAKSYVNADGDRVFVFDNDGTFKPYKGENSAENIARLDKALLKLLEDPKNEVWFVTARDVGRLEQTYGHIPGINMVGKQGMQFSKRNKAKLVLPSTEPMERFHAECEALAENAIKLYTGKAYPEAYRTRLILPVRDEKLRPEIEKAAQEVEEKMKKFISHHPDGKMYDVVVQTHRREGNEPPKVEVRIFHKEANDKGFVANLLLDQRKPDFGLSMGDMSMDEPMHKAMRENGHHAILVKDENPRPPDETEAPWDSYASHSLESHEDAITLLEDLSNSQSAVKAAKKVSLKVRIQQVWKNFMEASSSFFEKLKQRLIWNRGGKNDPK
ncbi:hypothetical protein PtB15_13B183 [Puccinia triticina]|nr:hypothetical protein PtB15_13B183 [Puccinia triticina]